MNRKIVIVAFVVLAATLLLSTLVWPDIKARELWEKSPERFVMITDAKPDFYVCGWVSGEVWQGRARKLNRESR